MAIWVDKGIGLCIWEGLLGGMKSLQEGIVAVLNFQGNLDHNLQPHYRPFTQANKVATDLVRCGLEGNLRKDYLRE